MIQSSAGDSRLGEARREWPLPCQELQRGIGLPAELPQGKPISAPFLRYEDSQ